MLEKDRSSDRGIGKYSERVRLESKEFEKEFEKLFEKSLKKYLTNAKRCANIIRHSREGTQERAGSVARTLKIKQRLKKKNPEIFL